MLFQNSFPPKLDIILLGGAEAPPAPMVETPMISDICTNISPMFYQNQDHVFLKNLKIQNPPSPQSSLDFEWFEFF